MQRTTRIAIAGAAAAVLLTGCAYAATAGTQDQASAQTLWPVFHWPCLHTGPCHTKSPSPTPTTTSPSPTPTTTSPSPTPTTTSPSPTPTTTSPPPAACTADLGGNCGPYDYPLIPMSNGFDTYVGPQNVGSNAGTTATVTVTDPGSWSAVVNGQPLGYTGVQIFLNVQQLTNDWNGHGWGSGSSDTPLSSLSALAVNYSETSPSGANDIYEYAPDIWTENYPSDVMFWADTHGRCDQGAFGGTVLGNAVLDGQDWTVHRYGGPGAEIIFVLDGSGGSGTCAQQSSGTIDLKAGFDWLVTNGIMTSPVFTQVNTGWEITSADNAAFTVNGYGITATAA